MRSTIGDNEVFWGDFHKHITQPRSNLDRIDDALEDARYNDIDVYPLLCYPFEWYRKGLNPGIREEHGRSYIGSRDIDLGVHVDPEWDTTTLRSKPVSTTLANIESELAYNRG